MDPALAVAVGTATGSLVAMLAFSLGLVFGLRAAAGKPLIERERGITGPVRDAKPGEKLLSDPEPWEDEEE